MLGPLIGAGASIAGGLINRSSAQATNQMSIHQAELNRAAQEEFAKKGIRWRVADARAAGIHPLYALGAQTTSFSPVSVGLTADTSFGSGVASAGQDISRAINATRTAPERVEATAMTAAQIEGLQLDNEIKRATLASQVQKITAAQNPPMPSLNETDPFRVPENKKPDERPPIMMGGVRIPTDPGTSPGKAYEDWLGDDIFSPGFLPNLYGALVRNFGSPATWPTQMMQAFGRKVYEDILYESANAGRFLGRFNLPRHGR